MTRSHTLSTFPLCNVAELGLTVHLHYWRQFYTACTYQSQHRAAIHSVLHLSFSDLYESCLLVIQCFKNLLKTKWSILPSWCSVFKFSKCFQFLHHKMSPHQITLCCLLLVILFLKLEQGIYDETKGLLTLNPDI